MKGNAHVDEGVKGLKLGIKLGKDGKADDATKAVEGAVTHLSEAK